MEQNLHNARETADERLAYSVAEASRTTGLGRTTLYGLIASGALPSRKIGKRRLIPAEGLRRLILQDDSASQ